MKHTFKKCVCGFIAATALIFFQNNPVLANENGPIVVQGIVQDGYDLEMNVQVANAETEELVETYKLNEDNNWVHKGSVPVGKYKVRVYVEGLSSRSLTKVKATMAEKEVVANPKEGLLDNTPHFVVIQGDEKYVSDFYGMVDFQRLDNSMLRGEITREEMLLYYEEAVAMQGEEAGLPVPDKVVERLEVDENKLTNEFKPETVNVQEEVNKAAAKKINSVEDKKGMSPLMYALIAGLIGAVAGFSYEMFIGRKMRNK